MDFSMLKNFMDDMARERTPGNAIEVYLDNQCVFRYESGFADYENRIPLSGEEYYNIYSCSKVATVTAGAQLLERGVFLLSDPLYEYIPEFRDMYIKDKNGEIRKANTPITIGNLFTMTAGFSYNMRSDGFEKARALTDGSMDTVQTIRSVASDPLLFEPGSHWEYSICHDVLAALISVVSGKKFREYVDENIFKPLDMNQTAYHQTPEIQKKMARQYRFVGAEGESLDIVEAQKNGTNGSGYFKDVGLGNHLVLGPEYDSGGAGIVTTVRDYAKLTAALANGGTGVNGSRILSPYTVDLMRENRLTTDQLKEFQWPQLVGCGYGLGVRTHIDKSASGLICNLGEFGWGGAAGSTVIIDPEIRLGVFYAQHTFNPREEYYQPRLRNVVYSCL